MSSARIFSALLLFCGFAITFYFNSFLFELISLIGFIAVTLVIAWLISAPFLDFFLNQSGWNSEKKAVLVTGCDTGFGHALATKLSLFGYKVFAGCLFPDGQGARKLKSLQSENLVVFKLDVTNDLDVDAAVKLVKDNLGSRQLWAVVNNAGIVAYKGIEYGPPGIGDYEKTMAVNALGSVRVTKAFLPLLKNTKNSRVILMASMAARIAFPSLPEYSMSKFAVRGFGDALRRELESYQIHVSMLEPTMYKTAMGDLDIILAGFEKSWNETPEDIKSQIGSIRYKSLKSFIKLMVASGISDTDQVVETMFGAIISSRPRYIYKLGSPFSRIITFIAELSPEELQDRLINGPLMLIMLRVLAITHKVLNW